MNRSAQETIIIDFDQFASDVFNQSEIPGMAIAITDRDHILYARGFGVTSLETPHPVTPDTIFLINSMSKAFTSALTGILVDRGVLSWNDSVISTFPDFALNNSEATKKITLGDLLVHNSGLYEYDGDLLFRMGLKPSEIVHQIRYLEPEKSFRSGYGYNNLHYFVVSEVISKKTGNPLSDNLNDLIFTPLGMHNTSIGFDFLSTPDAARCGYADHHVISENGYVPVPMDQEYLRGEYGEVGAGGISSNVIDMAKWLRLWLNGGEISGNRILQNDSFREIMRPANTIVSGPGFNFTYAKGWVVKCDPMLPNPVIWHNGATAGMSSYNGFIPEEGIGIVVLTNAGENGVADFIGDTFMFMISNPSNYHEFTNISALGSDIRPTVPVSKFSAVNPGRYDYPGLPGSYLNNYYGTMNIRNESGNFIAELGPRPLRLNLTPVNKTSSLFRFEPQIQNVSSPDGLFSFTFDAPNTVETISVQGLTNPDHPPVIFSRVS